MFERKAISGSRRLRRPFCGSLLLAFSLAATSPSGASGEAETEPTGVASVRTAALSPASPTRSVILERQRQETLARLDAISDDADVTRETLQMLDGEIADLRTDREAIRRDMIEAASRQKEASTRLSELEVRIAELSSEEGALKVSLSERRSLLAEVLAALQRMGRKPPPALLVKPQDALGSVRSAILLGAVVPGLREETRILVADLSRLGEIRTQLAADISSFGEELSAHRREEERLKRLAARKAELEETSLDRRENERRRADALASRASDLEDLVQSLKADVERAKLIEAAEKEAAERARAEEAKRLAQAQAQEEARRIAAAEKEAEAEAAQAAAALAEAEMEAEAGADPDAQTRLAMLEPDDEPEKTLSKPETYDIEALRRSVRFLEPSAPFSTLKGRLVPPVTGRRLVAFGDRDDIGRAVTGASYAARSGDVVTAPADAKVLYSGPFRSYGEVLIMDAGDAYHVVLAGMDRIDVTTGQFVSAGEPIGAMGSRRIASADATDFEAEGPALYVEFRHEGRPIDPSGWWTD